MKIIPTYKLYIKLPWNSMNSSYKFKEIEVNEIS